MSDNILLRQYPIEIITVSDSTTISDQTSNIENILNNHRLNYTLYDMDENDIAGELKKKYSLDKIKHTSLPLVFINQKKYDFAKLLQLSITNQIDVECRYYN